MSTNLISDAARRYLQLNLADGIGPIGFGRLLQHFGDVDAVFKAAPSQLQAVEGIGPQRAAAIIAARDDSAARREIERAMQHGLQILCPADAAYPLPLKRIPDPPVCLYVRGKFQPEDTLALAVVGSRQCSHYGREQAYRWGGLLATAGFTVVSGLARGVDAAAQRGAIEAGGRAIAVLGNGLATVYPPEHGELAVQIAARGAVVSELPVDSPPEGQNFPGRNRIIAGLALGVLVIEAAHQSGACITARLASEYNREVFALPGRVDTPTAFGVNAMIRDGQAKLVVGIEDVLNELGELGEKLLKTASASTETLPGLTPSSSDALPPQLNLSDDERIVLNALGTEPLDIDALIESSALPSSRVSAALTRLQLRGQVRGEGGRLFARR